MAWSVGIGSGIRWRKGVLHGTVASSPTVVHDGSRSEFELEGDETEALDLLS